MEEKETVKVEGSANQDKVPEAKSEQSVDENTIFDNTSSPEGQDDVTEAQEQQNDKEVEVEEDFKSQYLYLAAELENQKKRFQRERENLFKFGGEKILSDLIEIIDNLERTITAIEKDKNEKVKNIAVGVNMVKKQFLDTLNRHGLTPLESLGKEFDPSIHEAMAQEESDQESNRIIRVFEQGYKLNGRLLRAAKVVVAK